MDKHGCHNHADYAINPKRGRLQWEPSSTIMLEFGADASNGLCHIGVRKLAAKKSKRPTGGAGSRKCYAKIRW